MSNLWKQETGNTDNNISCKYLSYVPPPKYNWVTGSPALPVKQVNHTSANSKDNLVYFVFATILLFLILLLIIINFHSYVKKYFYGILRK